MKQSTKRFTTTALLVALIVLMGIVPYIGFIRIGLVEITLLAIPVIIGTLALGLRSGVILAFVFAAMSLLQVWVPGSVLGIMLWNISNWKLIAVIFIPRLFIPVVTYYTYRFLQSKYELIAEVILFAVFVFLGVFTFNTLPYYWIFFIPAGLILVFMVFLRKVNEVKLNYGIAGLFGSLTNTILFLGGIYALYRPEKEISNIAALFGTTIEGLMGILSTIAAVNGLPEAVLACVLSIAILIPLAKSGLTIENK